MNRMNAFFWARRKPSMELVRSVDALLDELIPEDSLDLEASFDALCVASDDGAGAAEPEQDVLALAAAAESGHDTDEDAPANAQHEGESSDDEPCDRTVPEDLESKWAKIRSVFQCWDGDQDERERKMDRMADLVLRYHVLEKVLHPKVMGFLTFETRKYVGHVFRAMTVHNLRGFVEYVGEKPEIMHWLVEGYKNNDTALACGAMLRDCFEHQTLAAHFLKDMEADFAFLFQVVMTNCNFDISADAFMNISRLLLEHMTVTATCLDAAFDRIFGLLNGLLTSKNYVTKRQALQLLAELLLNPVNFGVMQRYVASRNNLKLVMLLLREPSQALRMDAFHVFKIFVANPNKSPEVETLLLRNRDKLLAFVSDFGKNESNRDFHQEKSLLVFTLQRMAEKEEAPCQAPPGSPMSPLATSPTSGLPLASPVSEVVARQD